jgi:hypothetical protein
MNSAPHVQTLEISDAELDTISGGLAPHASAAFGPTAISDSSVLAQLDSAKNQVVGAVGQYNEASVNVSF